MTSETQAQSILEFKPLGESVLIAVELNSKHKESKTGIIIPPSGKDASLCIGKVIAVGDGKLSNGNVVTMQIQAGDKVLYPEWAGHKVSIEGHERKDEALIIVKASEILAITIKASGGKNE